LISTTDTLQREEDSIETFDIRFKLFKGLAGVFVALNKVIDRPAAVIGKSGNSDKAGSYI
jgi:hypothetical protein